MSLYQNIMTTVDASCRTFIQGNVVSVAEGIKEPALILLGVYVLFWGYAHLTNQIQEPITESIKRLTKVILILVIAFNTAIYNAYIVETFTSGPEELARLLSGQGAEAQLAAVIERLFQEMWQVGTKFWDSAGFFSGNLGFYVAAVIIYVLACLVSAYTAFLIILSKVAISVLIALGPLFIIATLFAATRRFFDNWIGLLCNYGLILVFVGVNIFILSVFNAYLAQAVTESGVEISSAAPVVITALISLFVLGQITGIAGGLSGSVSLSSMGAGRLTGRMLSNAATIGSRAIASSAPSSKHALRTAQRQYTGRGTISRTPK